MADIKTKERVHDIRSLDKSVIYGERMKKAFVRSKDQIQDSVEHEDGSVTEYAEDKLQSTIEETLDEVGHRVVSQIDKSVEQGRKAFYEHRQEYYAHMKAKNVEEAVRRYDAQWDSSVDYPNHEQNVQYRNQTTRSSAKEQKVIKTKEESLKAMAIKEKRTSAKAREGLIKTAEQANKVTVKTTETSAKAAKKTAKASAEAAKVSIRAAKSTAKSAPTAMKAAAKATAEIVKDMVVGMKSLVSAIIAGGWVAVLIVVIICVIGIILGSSFGIFFSNETANGGQTMYEAVQEINDEYLAEIDKIKADNPHDEYELLESRAPWAEVLAIYAVKVSADPDDAEEVALVNERKKAILKDVFWDMNEIDYSESDEIITTIVQVVDLKGNVVEKEVEKTITTLTVEISHLTAEEMAEEYRFKNKQKKQLEEMLDPDYDNLWSDVVNGILH